jgi:quercetin dioxygenase-like cupin family protein
MEPVIRSSTRIFVAKPEDGEFISRVGFGVHLKVLGEVTGGALSIVEFTIEPRRLVPPHTHISEDELSYVLDGEVGFRVGNDTTTGVAGTYVYKPKRVMHTFWNASDRNVRIMEIIAPAGFEESFRETGPRPDRRPNIHSDEWVPYLKERYGLKLLGES